MCELPYCPNFILFWDREAESDKREAAASNLTNVNHLRVALSIAKVEQDKFSSVLRRHRMEPRTAAPLNKTEAFLHHARSNVASRREERHELRLNPSIHSFIYSRPSVRQGNKGEEREDDALALAMHFCRVASFMRGRGREQCSAFGIKSMKQEEQAGWGSA